MAYRNDLIAGIVLMAFSVFYYISSLSIRVFSGLGKSIINSGTVPRGWAICLFLLSGALIMRSLKSKGALKAARTQESKAAFDLKETVKENYAVIGTFVFLGIYILLLESVGFIIMTSLYLFFQIVIMTQPGKRRYILTAILSISSSIIIYLFFVKFLFLLLPPGILSF